MRDKTPAPRRVGRAEAQQSPSEEVIIALGGWGPTIRFALLVLVRGVADRVGTARVAQRGRAAVTGVIGGIGALAVTVAKAHGWLG